MSEILADIVAEGRRLVERAEAANVPVRLLGGVAVSLHASGGLPAALVRPYRDLDFVAARGTSGPVASFFRNAGYAPHVAFNALNGQERLLFFDEARDRQLDVFVGTFRMCHPLPVADRLSLERLTIPLAELLLTKLQVVQLNEKDVRDALAILYGHDVADHDDDTVNARLVGLLCAREWGLWRTITANLESVRRRLAEYELDAEESRVIEARIDSLLEQIESEPKSRAWKLRAKVGERKRWYEIPEEVAGGP